MRNTKLQFLVILLLLIGYSLFASEVRNEKIVVISNWFQYSDEDLIYTERAKTVSKAYITTNPTEISEIKDAIRTYKKGPAYLCGYDLIFLHFINDSLQGRSLVNIECSKGTVGDFFTDYELAHSHNANLYTLKMTPGIYAPHEIEKSETSICFKYERPKAPYPKFSVRFFNRNSNKLHRQKLRELIENLEIIFPERLSIDHSPLRRRDSYGRAEVILPLDFDSSKIAFVNLPEIYETQYTHPKYSYLYIVAKDKSLDELRNQIAFDGLLSIDIREIDSVEMK